MTLETNPTKRGEVDRGSGTNEKWILKGLSGKNGTDVFLSNDSKSVYWKRQNEKTTIILILIDVIIINKLKNLIKLTKTDTNKLTFEIVSDDENDNREVTN